MGGLLFDEKTMIEGNLFKYEQRLKSHTNKYIENGAILTLYFSQDENNTTVDRGIKNIDELFGKHSPIRYNEINDMPLYGFGQTNPENNDELQIEDIDVEGECIILPSTIVPKPMDFFIIKHLKMDAIFEVKGVQYDSMKVEGYYKIQYRLHSTSKETIENIRSRVINKYHTDLNAIGSNINPIIKEDDFILRGKIHQMMASMIQSYVALFYNSQHNCFIYHSPETLEDYFDMCGNEFMMKYGLMNYPNSNRIIMLTKKIDDMQSPIFYNNSIYQWLELGAPGHMLQKFFYRLTSSNAYPYSSFFRWNNEVQIIQPCTTTLQDEQHLSFFNDDQFNAFIGNDIEYMNDYEKLIWKFINDQNISISDISLFTGDALLSSMNNWYIYLYTPIIIYIIRHILEMN